MTDRAAASVGFVLAGVALAAGAGGWPGGLGLAAAAMGATALVAFALRRYGRVDRGPADAAAAVAGAATVAMAVAAVVGPAVGGGTAAVAAGPALAAVAGVGVATLAYADWRGLDRSRLAELTGRGLAAAALGFGGLLAIFAWTVVIGVIYRIAAGDIDTPTAVVLSTLALGLGTGTVAWLYLRATDRGFDFVDLRRPTRRDAAYVVVGVPLLFGVNLGIGALYELLGLASARHGLIEIGQQHPRVLLVLVPLSVLLVGPGEELLYRNVVQKSLYGAFARPTAIVVTSVIFAGAHVPAYVSPGTSALAVLNTLTVIFALSIVLGVAFDRTRNVLVPALVHGAFNAIGFFAAYAQLAT